LIVSNKQLRDAIEKVSGGKELLKSARKSRICLVVESSSVDQSRGRSFRWSLGGFARCIERSHRRRHRAVALLKTLVRSIHACRPVFYLSSGNPKMKSEFCMLLVCCLLYLNYALGRTKNQSCTYSQVCGYVNARLSIAIVRATHLCMK
jgi:hypothetical protein